MDRKDAKRQGRYTQFAMAATKIALEDAKLDTEAVDKVRCGVLATIDARHRYLLVVVVVIGGSGGGGGAGGRCCCCCCRRYVAFVFVPVFVRVLVVSVGPQRQWYSEERGQIGWTRLRQKMYISHFCG